LGSPKKDRKLYYPVFFCFYFLNLSAGLEFFYTNPDSSQGLLFSKHRRYFNGASGGYFPP